VLGPQLFTIIINELDEGTKYNISKLTDDTKLGGVTGRMQRRLQGDLDKLSEWASTSADTLTSLCYQSPVGRVAQAEEDCPHMSRSWGQRQPRRFPVGGLPTMLNSTLVEQQRETY